MPRATTKDGRRWMAGDRVHQSYNKSISIPVLVFVTIAFPLRIIMMYEYYYVRIINIYAALLIIRLYII